MSSRVESTASIGADPHSTATDAGFSTSFKAMLPPLDKSFPDLTGNKFYTGLLHQGFNFLYS